MIDYKYYEYDGNDPGLEAMEYDGVEYQLDEFGEHIGNQDFIPEPDDELFDDDQAVDAGEGFRESLSSDTGAMDDDADSTATDPAKALEAEEQSAEEEKNVR